MITRIIIVALIAGLGYLNYTNPSEAEHKQAILAELEQQGWPVPEQMQEMLWKNVDFSNFMVCSFTKAINIDSKVISAGYLNKVKVSNQEWVESANKELQKRLAY